MNDFTVKGTLLEVKTSKYNKRDGTEGRSVEVIVDIPGKKFPTQVAIEYKGRDPLQVMPGDEIEIKGWIESRAGNTGRYFTRAITFEVRVTSRVQASHPMVDAARAQFQVKPADDLPF